MIKRELFQFNGIETLPRYWKEYFSMSQVGKTYEILYDDDLEGNGETLIMSNTEYEYYTNQRFFNSINKGDTVLSIGYGIGLIVPEVKRRGGKLTVIEKYQEVLDLEQQLDPEIEIVIGDINTIKFNETFKNRKFDVIFSDTSEKNEQKESLERLLKINGKLMFWTHLSVPRL